MKVVTLVIPLGGSWHWPSPPQGAEAHVPIRSDAALKRRSSTRICLAARLKAAPFQDKLTVSKDNWRYSIASSQFSVLSPQFWTFEAYSYGFLGATPLSKKASAGMV
jgi:hypothetical protein